MEIVRTLFLGSAHVETHVHTKYIANNMRWMDAQGQPMYQNGDCTHASSWLGSCCDRKHYWDGKELDNYPIRMLLVCLRLCWLFCIYTYSRLDRTVQFTRSSRSCTLFFLGLAYLCFSILHTCLAVNKIETRKNLYENTR